MTESNTENQISLDLDIDIENRTEETTHIPIESEIIIIEMNTNISFKNDIKEKLVPQSKHLMKILLLRKSRSQTI